MSKKVQEGFFDNVKRYMKKNLDKQLNKKIEKLLDEPTPAAKKALKGLAADIDRINKLYDEI
tara:strand:+ start:163 stop:348 length:186 start_codon:yes stop_codon:yes gene_type:complete